MYHQEERELELFDGVGVNVPGGYGLEPQEAFISGDFTKDKLAFIEKNRLGNRTCRDRPGQALLPTLRWRLTLQGLPI